MKKENVLVVEAHSDDSVISVAGFLEKFRAKYNYHFLLLAASDVKMHHAGTVTRAQRIAEYETYVKYFEGRWHSDSQVPLDADGELDQVPFRTLVQIIEFTINRVRPSLLICQGPSFHQDHRAVHEATMAATRPTSRFFPKGMYLMENPTYVHSLGPQTDFKPDTYVQLTERELKLKLNCFRTCFPSQIRKGDNYLSEEGIRSWARYRGIEARCQYAEALQTYIRAI
ncbi:MAG: PIG-L family deacetylase [Verrucomicrobiota bacterium]